MNKENMLNKIQRVYFKDDTKSMTGDEFIAWIRKYKYDESTLLTRTQQKYYKYIKQFNLKHKRQPTLFELAIKFKRAQNTIWEVLKTAKIKYASYRKIK